MSRSERISPRRGVRRREWVAWFAVLGLVTVGMLAIRDRLNEAHITLAYLLVVQGGSARGGRPLGIALASVAFLCFDLIFLPPFGTLTLQDPLNWLVLLAFLVTSILSAQLLYRAQAEADAARDRAAEIDRLAALGAETLNAGRAEEALTAIVSVIRSSLRLDGCEVYTADPRTQQVRLASESGATADHAPVSDRLLDWVVAEGANASEQSDGTSRVDVAATELTAAVGGTVRPNAFLRPLQVRGATVGVLRISSANGLVLSPAQVRVLDALSYYAALGVERVRLAAEADRATALQEAHRAKDAVLASVSHDLRTPLTTIKGLAHEIAEGGDERAEIIEEETDRLNLFVAQMLDLSRIATGVAVTDVQPNEAEDLLGAAAQQVGGRLRGRELRIDVSSQSPLLFGRFDFAQTLRALVNLIENAAKYSPPGAAIDLSASRDGQFLAFSVADRGPGVPLGERERIFEPFYRRSSGAPDVGGAGLGLSIARGIAEAQGGSVTLRDRDGSGSVFTLRVPAIDAGELGDGAELLGDDVRESSDRR
ncbi:MAG TPA: ATP-binding protein [Gemmatimonadaceae bacterium]|nr:ATP-binding protein [Gemmatimonadaceae bacterium]